MAHILTARDLAYRPASPGSAATRTRAAPLSSTALFFALPCLARLLIVATGSILLGDPLDGADPLGGVGIEDDDSLGAASGNPNAIDRTADQLAAVCHQHDLVAILDRHRGNELAVSLVDRHRDDAFAAASGDAIFEGRCPLAVAIRGNGQNDLFGSGHFRIAVRSEVRRHRRFLNSPFLASRFAIGLGRNIAGNRAAHLKISETLAAVGLDVT